jgi:Reverse transcriptase (RNA-dependent DNA polymerase)
VKKFRNMTQITKCKLECKLALENGGNNKPLYRYAYQKSRLKNTSPVSPLKNKQGRVISDNAGMAKLLNEFFSVVFTEERDCPVSKADACQVDETLSKIRADKVKVKKKISALKPAAALGPDGIGSMLLKELIDQVTSQLVKIFNQSLAV